jgi:hypothetical protein
MSQSPLLTTRIWTLCFLEIDFINSHQVKAVWQRYYITIMPTFATGQIPLLFELDKEEEVN